MVQYLADKAAFDKCLADAGDKTVAVDFTATWCPPCKAIGPKFEAMAKEFPNVVCVKCDVDAAKDVAEFAGISCMPTFKFWKNGKEVEADKIEGANEAKLREVIGKHN